MIIATGFVACNNAPKDYVTYSGKIDNHNPKDTVISIAGKNFRKNIKINSDGTFSDTLTLKNADYYSVLINNKRSGFVFLRNGFDIKLSTDATSFLENTKYSGKGASSTNFLINQVKYGKSTGDPRQLFLLEKDAFLKRIKAMRFSFDSLKTKYKDIDTMVVRTNDKQNSDFFDMLEKSYDMQHQRAKEQAKAGLALAKGKTSPKFENYINYKGGKSSLASFKGKYVYIDVWATWCKPCLAEIPALKSLEKKYHNKNIEFVSISIDDERTAGSWDKAQTKWKDMVAKKNLSGTQLYAGKDIQFMKDYQVTGIPRFILIDPQGNIVNANAPRPSNPSLENTFKELGL